MESATHATLYVPGVFDLIHRGHHRLLRSAENWARGHYDTFRFVIGVHTDDFVTAYKRRPFQNEQARLGAVGRLLRRTDNDLVVLVGESHREVCVRHRVDYLVHGSDWEIEDYKRQINYDELEPLGVKLQFVDYTSGISTTQLLATGVPQALTSNDQVLIDLDGTLTLDGRPRHRAVEILDRLGARGKATIVTNNNYMTKAELRRSLLELGFCDVPVISSTDHVAGILREMVTGEEFTIFVWGTMESAKELHGLLQRSSRVVASERDCHKSRPDVVVLLHRRDFTYSDLAQVCTWIHSGVPYIQGNLDSVYPSSSGLLPDTHCVRSFIQAATSVPPLGIAGKPWKIVKSACLVVGDRSNTDGKLAETLGCPWHDASTDEAMDVLADCLAALNLVR
jgi:cytidyltransferase-like protein